MIGRLALVSALLLTACRAPAVTPYADAGRATPGDEIVVCGERFATGAPVVLWFEEPRYDAYSTEPRFADDGPRGLRYRPGRRVDDEHLAARVAARGWTRNTLADAVDLFVLHYDVCGTSRTCFEVLHDRRELSVHFLLDIDGTIYQTLDLVDEAWHARQANPRSIGIEIAQIGAYPREESEPLETWYIHEDGGVRLQVPFRYGDGGVRTPHFLGRPARRERITGEIQGEKYEQYDFTPEQYDSLVKLTATLARVFPHLELDAPRDASGAVRTDALSDDELRRFRGILGHYHVSEDKRDPGPAFDWEAFLAAARAR